MDDVVLGIDLGTSASKAVLVTPEGEVVARAHRDHTIDLPRPGWAEIDAEAVWWDEVVSLSRELLATDSGRAGKLAGVCVSGVGPCLVMVDTAGRPVRPAVLYGIDTRAAIEIDQLTSHFGQPALLKRCGKLLSSQSVGPKLAWMRRHEPETWSRAARWHGSSSWVVEQLTGEYVQDHITASQCDPLYDLPARQWAQDWAEEVAPGLPLPRLAWPSEVVGEVSPRAATATGLPVGTPVVAGTVDAWAEALSAGVRQPGEAMLMYGSTTFVVQILDHLLTGPAVWTVCGNDPEQYTLAGGTATAGSLIDWIRALTGKPSWTELINEAAAVPAGSEGLIMLPHFAGERTPLHDPTARGVLAGLTLRHGRGHIVRAALEGTAMAIDQVLGAIGDVGGQSRRLVAVGGGTRNSLWMQIVSDVTGAIQQLPAQKIGACYGGAFMAATGAGLTPADSDWSEVVAQTVPSLQNADVYAALRASYAHLQTSTRTTLKG